VIYKASSTLTGDYSESPFSATILADVNEA